MSILPLVIAPDPLLNQPSEKVEKIEEETLMLLDDMLETMYDSRGIGLAAVQVGYPYKLVVVDVNWRENEFESREPYKLINPEIVETSQENNAYDEGCLSFPDQYSEVIRPETVTIKYLDTKGAEQTMQADGLLATCIQHEIDHTNGINFVDHISKLKRDRIIKKLTKAKKQGRIGTGSACGDDSCTHEHR